MPTPTNITAVLICKNAERTLSACLASLTWCDHIILGDDSSTDHSVSIAKHHHVDVIKLPAGLDFAAKRNYLLPYVHTEWILMIDTDEIVSPNLASELTSGKWQTGNYAGFSMRRRDIFMGKKLRFGEAGAMPLLRLARRGAGTWKRSVHEVWDIAGPLGTLDGVIFHYSHPTLEEFFEKIDLYTTAEVASHRRRRLLAYFQLFLYPPGKFLYNYMWKRGFLDGYAGLVLAWMMSFHSLCVRIKSIEVRS